MSELDDPYHELYVYTMGRPRFILQHVVDANMAQRLDATNEPYKPIGAIFALAGLYLHVERGFTGSEVQQAHKTLGRRKREWPAIAVPDRRGEITAAEVMRAPAGAARDAAIDDWCRSVWNEFQGNRDVIIALLKEYEII
jgi:hypothetical protein